MVGLKTGLATSERTAFFLYVVLVILPAAVFGGLLWHQMTRDHAQQLEEVPQQCSDAAKRLSRAVQERLGRVLDQEFGRPFYHYRKEFYEPTITGDMAFSESPLDSEPLPEGVLGWYAYSGFDDEDTLEVFGSRIEPGGAPATEVEDLREFVKDELIYSRPFHEEFIRYSAELELAGVEGFGEKVRYPLRTLALNLGDVGPLECLDLPAGELAFLDGRFGEITISYFQLAIQRDEAGRLRVFAERSVVIPVQEERPGIVACFEPLTRKSLLRQGVFIDPIWLLERVPRELAAQVLGPARTFLSHTEAQAPLDDDTSLCHNNLFEAFEATFEFAEDVHLGDLYVATDRGEMRRRFRAQVAWFLGVALIMAISMAIGIRLLLGSIRASREEAQRTRNFVASVTHELRTPIAAVKLYGEMLSEGWITDETRRSEYLERIVRESDRLDALVDRVLLRRRLSDQPQTPTPGDLNAAVERQRADLMVVGGTEARDLAFELAPDLKPVLLVPDGIHVILTNLVENARKYAPVDPDAEGAESILVRTRLDRRGRVVLEVLDRGPGIPEDERGRIFDAFYRRGDESTRETKGTGLGLHLVALQARAMKAKVEALPRKGGGTTFRVTLRSPR